MVWINEKIGDSTGRVFIAGGRVFRGIYPESEERVRELFTNGLVQQLVESGHLIRTWISEERFPGFNLVLEHEKVAFFTEGNEWCYSLLRDTAMAWIDLNLLLLKRSMAISDAHAYNFGQVGASRPVWLDFGSLRKITSTEQAFVPFEQNFLTPLRIVSRAPELGKVVHSMIRDGGITKLELQAFPAAVIPRPWRWLGRAVVKLRRWKSEAIRRGGEALKLTPDSTIEPTRRARQLEAWKEELNEMDFGGVYSFWGGYHQRVRLTHGDLEAPPPDQRTAAILKEIGALKPKRVIDLASNAGYFSFFAAARGAEVLAVDFDEPSIEKLYSFLKKEQPNWKVTCAVRDVTAPLIGGRAIRVERSADLVMALALMHHLNLTEGYTFKFIADLLASYTTDAALVEYMPCGRGGTKPKPDPLPAGYTLENFLVHLRERFATAEVVADNKEHAWRTLILCRGRFERKGPE